MFKASAAPRWKSTTSVLPLPVGLRNPPLSRSCANTVRRRNVGFNPIVANAIAPDFMNTRRFISVSSLTTLKFRSPEREADHLQKPLEIYWTSEARQLYSRETLPILLRLARLTSR